MAYLRLRSNMEDSSVIFLSNDEEDWMFLGKRGKRFAYNASATILFPASET